MVKREISGVQMALTEAMAEDDQRAGGCWTWFRENAHEIRICCVFTNVTGVGSMEVNVFQLGCDFVAQKSIHEGFSLVVSEALWKEKPLVAGRAGGISMQFPEGFDEYLVDVVEDCARRITHLCTILGARPLGTSRTGKSSLAVLAAEARAR